MAQQCSACASVHFLHCMNYVREMKGAIWVDWIMDRLAALQSGLEGEAGAIQEVRRGSCPAAPALLGGALQQVVVWPGSPCSVLWVPSWRAVAAGFRRIWGVLLDVLSFPSTAAAAHACVWCGRCVFVCVQFVRGSLERSNAEIASSYAALGVDKLLLSNPTVENPRNVLDVMLQSRMYSVSRRGLRRKAVVLVTGCLQLCLLLPARPLPFAVPLPGQDRQCPRVHQPTHPPASLLL